MQWNDNLDWKEIKDRLRNSIKRKLIFKNEGKTKTLSDKTMRIHHRQNCTEVDRYTLCKKKSSPEGVGMNERNKSTGSDKYVGKFK